MRKHDVFPGKYLRKEDVEFEPTLTVRSVEKSDIEDDFGKTKYALHFKEQLKPMILNSTTWDVLEEAFGDSDDWAGKKVVVYFDPSVSYQGKRTGGLRVRVPKAKRVAEPVEDFNDKIPM